MKNNEEEPREYFERNILLVVVTTVSALIIDWLSIKMLLDVNPWGTATAIPGLMLTLQGLWFIVNPYAVVYEDRFEIKQSLISNKEYYYLDAKSVDQKKTHSMHLVYNDGDIENISLIGMRDSHKLKFKEALSTKIVESLKTRSF
ncbi:MAG: hypothetical protein V4565_02260 [Bacteroidota bacterium]